MCRYSGVLLRRVVDHHERKVTAGRASAVAGKAAPPVRCGGGTGCDHPPEPGQTRQLRRDLQAPAGSTYSRSFTFRDTDPSGLRRCNDGVPSVSSRRAWRSP